MAARVSIIRPSIFISHSSSDRDFVRIISADLNKAGIACWEANSGIWATDSLEAAILNSGIPKCTLFCSYLSLSYLNSPKCMEELNKACASGRVALLHFVDSEATLQTIPSELRDSLHYRVLDKQTYSDCILHLSATAWGSLQTAELVVPSEDHILAGPAIFDSEGYTRKDLLKRVKGELILAAANLRSWLSDRDSRDQLVELVRTRRIRVTLILATHETLGPISVEGATHLRQSVDDIKRMVEQLNEEERTLMQAYFHIGQQRSQRYSSIPSRPTAFSFSTRGGPFNSCLKTDLHGLLIRLRTPVLFTKRSITAFC
jgi:TIR domain